MTESRQRLADRLRGKPRDPAHMAGVKAYAQRRKAECRDVRQCACGCGATFVTTKGNVRRYLSTSHFHKGRARPKKWRKRIASSVTKAWTQGKYDGKRRPDYMAIGLKLRGRKFAPEFGQAISERLTGKKLSEEHRRNCSKTWLKGPQFLSPDAEQRRRQSISKQRKGTHGYGRMARDNQQHCKALHWIVRDPRAVIHEFDNLQSWCRKNEWRFLPDERPESKLPLWSRAVGGFNNQQRTDRKASHHWRGWTLVSVLERLETGAPDLLGRG